MSGRKNNSKSRVAPRPVRDVRIVRRSMSEGRSLLRLSDGDSISCRRFYPAGTGDTLRFRKHSVEVFAKNDGKWVTIDPAWSWVTNVDFGSGPVEIVFKEIETDQELELFEGLRRFHYRGAGGVGRTVPLIARASVWDLPRVLGFIEIASSMIANTARKKFFDAPFFESADVSWKSWDANASKNLSNTISRISRFVIHPELRGLGLAQPFLEAAKRFSSERWHYGGRTARFVEITADMLRYYRFVGPDFAFMGQTEGNEHRLVKDMTYLVRKALSEGEGMPQGGGGIMTLQRQYASRLLKYLDRTERSLGEVVRSLQHNPALLNQDTWEALHRLNRKPKLSFVAGLTPQATDYVKGRRTRLQLDLKAHPRRANSGTSWTVNNLTLTAHARISQSSEARVLQDTFGFVGSKLTSELIEDLTFELNTGQTTLVCGASGSGKSLLLEACKKLLTREVVDLHANEYHPDIEIKGEVSRQARVVSLPVFDADQVPLDLRGRSSLDEFLKIAAKCGLAEPQIFVRPISSLSSGQRYRLRVALAFLANPDILLIDNFCEPLDRYTAISVTRGIKRLAAERAVAVLGATAAYDRAHLFDGVDQLIMLRRGDKAIVQRGGSFELQEGFLHHSIPFEQ